MRTDHELAKMHQHLMSLPLTTWRQRLSKRIRAEGDALTSRAAKYLTLHSEYAARRTYERVQANPPSCVYPSWCRATRQSAPIVVVPPYRTAPRTLAEYVAEFDRLNHLSECTPPARKMRRAA